MTDSAVSRRYAEGFLSFSRETIGVKEASEGLGKLKDIIKANPGLGGFLENPEIEFSDKQSFMGNVFRKDFPQEILDFLEFIIAKGRINQVAQIADCAKIIYQREVGIEKAIIKTAFALDEKLLRAIKERLEKKLRKKLELEVSISPDLIGGVQAFVGNVVIDGTVKSKLRELKENLLNIKVS